MKILIISHNQINDYENMGKTMLSLFSSFEEKELMQFYIYPSIPNINICNSYFRITDKEVLSTLTSFKTYGRVINKEEIKKDNGFYADEKSKDIYKNTHNKKPSRAILRDLLWKIGRWNTKQLNNWIKTEKPTHIFAAVGDAKFIYDITSSISKKYKLPIISYICDDYYFYPKEREQAIKRLQRNLLRKKIKKLIKLSNLSITISEKMTQAYKQEFNANIDTVMTGANIEISDKPQEQSTDIVLSYFGNISLGRYQSLFEIGEALDVINKENNKKYILNIYTGESNINVINKLESLSTICLKEYISGEEVHNVMKKSAILLHVESFESAMVDRVAYSVSTKIADSLASGVCLFAYGPSHVASVAHLIDNDCACIVTNKDELQNTLLTIINDADLRLEYAKKGLIAAQKYHNAPVTSEKLKEMVKSI